MPLQAPSLRMFEPVPPPLSCFSQSSSDPKGTGKGSLRFAGQWQGCISLISLVQPQKTLAG